MGSSFVWYSCNGKQEQIAHNLDCMVGEKVTLTTSDNDLFANDGDIVIKCEGKLSYKGE